MAAPLRAALLAAMLALSGCGGSAAELSETEDYAPDFGFGPLPCRADAFMDFVAIVGEPTVAAAACAAPNGARAGGCWRRTRCAPNRSPSPT